MITTKEQLNSLKEFLQVELLKRGFNVFVEHIKENPSYEEISRIDFQTTSFQTTPVLFKELHVNSFNSSVMEQEKINEEKGLSSTLIHIWLSIYVSYKLFGGGSNGFKLMDVKVVFFKEESQIVNSSIS